MKGSELAGFLNEVDFVPGLQKLLCTGLVLHFRGGGFPV